MKEHIASLSINDRHYSVFRFGDLQIKFYTSPYLDKYCSIDRWDNDGYIEYTGILATTKDKIEDSIDLAFIAERLRLTPDVFSKIDEVKIV